jgi:hypothetical protein
MEISKVCGVNIFFGLEESNNVLYEKIYDNIFCDGKIEDREGVLMEDYRYCRINISEM